VTVEREEIGVPPLVETFLEEVTRKVNPKFRIRNKAHPTGAYWLASKVVGLFNKRVDTNYITVINGQCWFPADFFDESGNMTELTAEPWRVIQTLSHETMHEYDRKRLGTVPFTLLYLFPQVLGALGFLSLLAFWNLSWLWCLLFFLFLAPLPAPGRAYLELRGYKVNMMYHLSLGWPPEPTADHYAKKHFVGPAYYFMMPFKGWVTKRLLDRSHEDEQIYQTIREWWKRHQD
jgi:hypothetical protein